MERRKPPSEFSNQAQFGESESELAKIFPLALRPEKKRRLTRMERSLSAGAHPHDRSRKTPGERAAIQKAQALKDLPLQQAIGAGVTFYIDSSGEKPTLSAPVPVDLKALCEELGVDESVFETPPLRRTVSSSYDKLEDIHEEVMEIFKEEQEGLVPLNPRHLEGTGLRIAVKPEERYVRMLRIQESL